MSRFRRSLQPLLDVIDNYGKYDLSFDGGDDWVDTGLTSIGGVNLFASPENSFTVEAWFKFRGTGTIIARAGASQMNRTFQIARDSTGYFLVILRGHQNFIGQIVTIGNWHHCAVTWDGTSAKLYFDGTEYALTVGTAAEETTQRILFGARSNGPVIPLNGEIRDVRIWNIARTQTEIQDSMNKTLIGNETGLVGLWMLQEGAGNIAYDRSPLRNNATIKGASWVVKS